MSLTKSILWENDKKMAAFAASRFSSLEVSRCLVRFEHSLP